MTTPGFSVEQGEHSRPQWEMLGEPVTRPDGYVLSLHRTPSGLAVQTHHTAAVYSDEEVMFVGNGDWQAGAMLLAQGAYSCKAPIAGKPKPF